MNPLLAAERQQKTFLTAEWRDLAIVNFEIDPQILEPYRPTGTVIDTWQGRCFVSVVGFRFLRTRLLGIPVPLHRDFEEVNLRFYVRRSVAGQPRRGVVFVKEAVPRRAVAWMARAVYNENYVTLPMRHRVGVGCARYEWLLDGRWNRLAVEAHAPAGVPAEGSAGSYFAEHNWGYGTLRDGSTIEYRVDRPRWQVAPAQIKDWSCSAGQMYGAAFAPCLGRGPASVFLAHGSQVKVRRGRRVQTL